MVAALVPLIARMFKGKTPPALALHRQIAINFIVLVAVLSLGLWFFGRDGKMTTYLALVLVGATSQWIMLRGWRA